MSLTRRDFLQSTGVAAVTAAVGTGAAGTEPACAATIAFPVIDCHTHFYDPRRPEGVPWPGRDSSLYRTVLPADLRKLPQHLPVTGTIVVEASSWLRDNDWLLELGEHDPWIVGVVGNLNPESEDFVQQVRRLSANRLFRGIRVSVQRVQGLLQQQRSRVLGVLAEHDLALDVNGGPETPELLSRLAAEQPQLRIVLNHLGNPAITSAAPQAAWVSGIRAAAGCENVFCKVSALVEGASRNGGKAPEQLDFYRPFLDVVWGAFGDGRVIYGSNWPVSEQAADYRVLQKLVADYAVERGVDVPQRFFGGNSKAVWKWADR
ncbi:MAG TPA: amidohydrolase [Planctomycetaceae bacterium]|jgi:predicted TIM-barrel fold metal-dependent hydrolase|nr:amidohydrolase [Planctomycetaceae bacterium]